MRPGRPVARGRFRLGPCGGRADCGDCPASATPASSVCRRSHTLVGAGWATGDLPSRRCAWRERREVAGTVAAAAELPGGCRARAVRSAGPGDSELEAVTAWAEPDGLTRAEPLELCDESVARTVPSQYNPERRETSNKEIQPLLRHVHRCISRSRSIPGVSSASVRINKCYHHDGSLVLAARSPVTVRRHAVRMSVSIISQQRAARARCAATGRAVPGHIRVSRGGGTNASRPGRPRPRQHSGWQPSKTQTVESERN
jgi:hypothetical protein